MEDLCLSITLLDIVGLVSHYFVSGLEITSLCVLFGVSAESSVVVPICLPVEKRELYRADEERPTQTRLPSELYLWV
jgi:hypothetical protein